MSYPSRSRGIFCHESNVYGGEADSRRLRVNLSQVVDELRDRLLRVVAARGMPVARNESSEKANNAIPKNEDNGGAHGVSLHPNCCNQAFSQLCAFSSPLSGSKRAMDSMTMSAPWTRVNFGGVQTNQKGSGQRSRYADYRMRLSPSLRANCICGHRHRRLRRAATGAPRGSGEILSAKVFNGRI